MLSFLVSRENLTPDQLRAVEFNMEEHRVVVGGPGSGKTIVILHRARFLVDKYHVDHNKYRIFVFTKVLKEYIRSSLELLGLPEDCVTTFDSWCISYYRRNISRYLPRPEKGIPDFDDIRNSVLKHLDHPLTKPVFDFILVDEGQDLNIVAYEILKRIGKHLSVFMDHNQQVYENGSTEQDVLKSLGFRRRNVGLLETYRCCPYIVSLASNFLINPKEREAYLNQNRIPQTERETPVLHIASDFDDEIQLLADTVRVRQNMGEKIAILVPQKKVAFHLAKLLSELNLRIEIPRRFEGADNCFDFNSPYPKIMPYHSAKGLTFDTVLLPRLVPRLLGSMSDERLNKILFVAITRATKWVFMSTVRAAELPFFKGVVRLEKEGKVTIRRNDTEPDLFKNAAVTDSSTNSTKDGDENVKNDISDFF